MATDWDNILGQAKEAKSMYKCTGHYCDWKGEKKNCVTGRMGTKCPMCGQPVAPCDCDKNCDGECK